MKSKTIALSLISLVSVLALAGCQNSGDTTPADTTATDKPADTAATDSTPADTATDSKPADGASASEVKTPSGAKDLTSADVAGNKVTTYKADGAIADACAAQAKMVTDAGWKASAMTASPITTAQAWTQTFESGDQMVVLACAEDPTAKGTVMVTMTQTKNMMMN